ncbi:MAG: sensor histidine kinase [Bacteroidales bacterium]|jgi:signal transduction histidine kinase|nr:sensor histidine kinase [Bacteroidales bacterium]NCU36870.1 tetratricopeptide repeat protein [Candidatus Falkowbacteria bacterium]MDD2632918.1 sensor histidine kinase [Bacteroidales bacterium]MDD4177578.1 sensor histidine kinase [Bacteroidales bacterium]MDD4741045.1 sensor histidine kinase [Bacteroidales bacterium]
MIIFLKNIAVSGPLVKSWFFKKQGAKYALSVKLIFALILVMFIFPGEALLQPQAVKSPEVTKEISVIDSLFAEGLTVLYTDPQKTRNLVTEALALTNSSDTVRILRAYIFLGATYQLQASYDKGMEYFFEGLKYARKGENVLLTAHLYNNLGSSYLKMGNHKDALKYFMKSSRIYENLKSNAHAAATNNNIGLLYMELNNYDMALAHFKDALRKRPKANSIGMAATYSNLGTMFFQMGQIDSAFYYHQLSINLDLITDNKYGLAVGYESVANTYLETGQYDKAIANYLLSKHVSNEINHSYQTGLADLGLSKIYLTLGNTKKAMLFADSAFQIAEKLGNIKLQQETHAVYSEIFEKNNNYKKALENYQTFINLRDSMINQAKLHQIYNLEIDELSMAAEIQKLEIQRQELQLSKKNNIIYFIVAAFVLTLAGTYLLYKNRNHLRNANHQKAILSLNEKKSRAATEAEMQERKRIGQDLHDGLGQMLSVARLNISVLQQRPEISGAVKKELLDAALNSVDGAFFELRNISHNLAPSVLSSKGLAKGIREMVDQVNQSKQINVQLEMYGLSGTLDEILENTLYRAAQELMSNTIKHSQAKNFDLQIIKSDKEITLMAEDDGNGFEMTEALMLNGGGLSNIRSRVENLKGNVFIDSKGQRGTIVTIVIPLTELYYDKASH